MLIMKKTLIILGSWLLALSAPAADIVALCIGNNAYTRVEDSLDTPINDATLMKRTLEALPGGADVKILTDATKEDIEIALNALKVRAQGAKLALVFYSGHGTEDQPDGFAQNETFLLPVDATIPDVNYLPTRAVSLSTVLTALKAAPVTARAVILDCCRSGAPRALAALASTTKSFGDLDERVKTALGKAVVPDATLIAFAASPGRKAAAFLTEADENSPFTTFLTQQFATGAGNLRDLVEAAAEETETRTGKRQVPYVSYNGAASAIRQITFRSSATVPSSTSPAMNAAEIERRAEELAAQMAKKRAVTPAMNAAMNAAEIERRAEELAAQMAKKRAVTNGKVVVTLETNKGTVELELDASKAPASVANFLRYVRSGHYDGTIFHRVIPGFMIQGGGFNVDMEQKPTDDPIKNEGSNGLKNVRGSIAAARTSAPDSATAQFFINVKDNDNLDYPSFDGHGYAVFGRVVQGMDVIDAMVGSPTTVKGPHSDVPVSPIVIIRAKVEE